MADSVDMFNSISSINAVPDQFASECCELPATRICRCCLAAGFNMEYSTENDEILLELLTGPKLSDGPGMSWLCYRCAHTMKRLSSFRDLCIRADSILRNVYAIHPYINKDALNSLRSEHKKNFHTFEPTLSNTLCIDVTSDYALQSHTSVLSMVESKNDVSRNYSPDMVVVCRRNYAEEIGDKRLNDGYNENLLGFDYEMNPDFELNVPESTYDVIVNNFNSHAEMFHPKTEHINTLYDIGKTFVKLGDSKKEYTGKVYMENRATEFNKPDFMNNFDCTYICKICELPFGNPAALPNHHKFCKGRKPHKDTSKKERHLGKQRGSEKINDREKKEDIQILRSVEAKLEYVCKECDKTFTHLSFLERHGLSHQKRYTCSKCDEQFQSVVLLEKHASSHLQTLNPIDHSCEVCGSLFARHCDLTSHKLTHADGRIHSCVHCGISFVTSSALAAHAASHAGSKCEICKYVFKNDDQLAQHMLTHRRSGPLNCDACSKTFSKPSNLKKHNATVHSEARPFSCDKCGKSFKLDALLKSHMRIHSSRQSYVCEECGVPFRSPYNLKVHRFKHTGERPFSCDECGKAFRAAGNLKLHKMVHSGHKAFKCEICGLAVQNRFLLKEHFRLHTGEKPFSCHVCGKAFRRKVLLKVHNRIHSGEKPFECAECGKKFISWSDLNIHKRLHSGVKPFPCSVCGRSFLRKSCLMIHWRTHTGERPFSCDVCGKSFTVSSNMKLHKRIHTGESFPCDICSYRGLSASRVKVHRMIHTGEKPYACDLCTYKTTTSKQLKRHKMTHNKATFY